MAASQIRRSLIVITAFSFFMFMYFSIFVPVQIEEEDTTTVPMEGTILILIASYRDTGKDLATI
jgi:uncharacterized membrane protein